MPTTPTELDTVLEYEILERSGSTLSVEFKNPYYVGILVKEEYEEDGETKTRSVDNDPNKHLVKSINIPLNKDGTADRVELKQIIADQAMGVKHRMEATKLSQVEADEVDLDGLVGSTL